MRVEERVELTVTTAESQEMAEAITEGWTVNGLQAGHETVWRLTVMLNKRKVVIGEREFRS